MFVWASSVFVGPVPSIQMQMGFAQGNTFDQQDNNHDQARNKATLVRKMTVAHFGAGSSGVGAGGVGKIPSPSRQPTEPHHSNKKDNNNNNWLTDHQKPKSTNVENTTWPLKLLRLVLLSHGLPLATSCHTILFFRRETSRLFSRFYFSSSQVNSLISPFSSSNDDFLLFLRSSSDFLRFFFIQLYICK